MGARGTPHVCLQGKRADSRLFESLTGARMTCNYMRFGGCRCDVSPAWLHQAQQVVEAFPKFLDEFEALLSENEVLVFDHRESEPSIVSD